MDGWIKSELSLKVTERLAGLAAVLEELLGRMPVLCCFHFAGKDFPEAGLNLAVPQSVMAACYPPRASYKMHLDSYFLQGLSFQGNYCRVFVCFRSICRRMIRTACVIGNIFGEP